MNADGKVLGLAFTPASEISIANPTASAHVRLRRMQFASQPESGKA
jgi:hypothetical protein